MKKTFIFLLLALTTNALAAPVDRSEALRQAQQFMQQHGRTLSVARSSYRAPRRNASASTENAAYYVFNNDGGGFVIVSGDDRTTAILGYSTTGQLSQDSLPVNVSNWLRSYADEIDWMDSHPTEAAQLSAKSAAVRKVQQARHAVEPLLSSEWNQSAPYNNRCPVFYYNDGTTEQSVTGCVATSMAQVMYYHKYPDATIAEIPQLSNRYNTSSGTQTVTLSPVAAGTTIDWTNMLPSYDDDATETEQNAVANLMLLCGQSVKMNYGPSSGAADKAIRDALTTYFGYDEDATYVSRSNYTISEWNELMYNEVANGRPVCYGGQSTGGGHAFVIDGYDGEAYYHVNWGWGGHDNGYFALSVLNPGDNSGIGASSTDDGYSMSQDAIIGIQKPDGVSQQTNKHVTASNLIANGKKLQVSWNAPDGVTTYDFGLAFLNEDGSVGNIYSYGSSAFGSSNLTSAYTLGTLANGTYRLIPVSKVNGTDEWLVSVNDAENYFVITVSNGSYTSSVHTSAVENSELSATFSIDGLKYVNATHTINTVVTNAGGEYNGNIYLFASTASSDVATVSYNANDSRCLTAAGCPLAKGDSHTFSTTFTPTSAATYYIWATSDEDGKVLIGQTQVKIVNGTLSSSISLTGMKADNQADATLTGTGIHQVYGTHVKGSATVKNNDSKNPFSGKVDVWLWTTTDNSSYTGRVYTSQNVTIPAGGTAEVPFEYTGANGMDYCIQLKVDDISFQNNWYDYMFECIPGFVQYNSDGSSTASGIDNGSATVSSEATAVDLRGCSDVTKVTPNSNPNTVYYLDQDATVGGLDDANVVRNSTIGKLQLTDGYDFWVPEAFTATEVEYERTPSVFADGTNGWSTLVLPFDVDKIQIKDGKAIDFFHSATDEDKDFWLNEFNSIDDDNTVVFGFTQSVKANVPYIVAFPGSKWGESYSFKGKTVVFHGSDATISTTDKIVASTDVYTMRGQYAASTLTNAYLMNNAGNSFVLTASGSEGAFRTYFTSKSTSAAGAKQLKIRIGDTATGISSVSLNDSGDGLSADVYNLAGVRVGSVRWSNGQPVGTSLPKGIYIINGKKWVVK